MVCHNAFLLQSRHAHGSWNAVLQAQSAASKWQPALRHRVSHVPSPCSTAMQPLVTLHIRSQSPASQEHCSLKHASSQMPLPRLESGHLNAHVWDGRLSPSDDVHAKVIPRPRTEKSERKASSMAPPVDVSGSGTTLPERP